MQPGSQSGPSHLVSETITAAHHTLPVNAADSPLDACFLPSILRSPVLSFCREHSFRLLLDQTEQEMSF